MRGATLAELEPPSVEVADLRVSGGRITARGQVEAQPADEVIDAAGKLVLPGLVSAHHHLTATLLRGIRRGRAFEDVRRLREQLAAALTLDDVAAASAAGALEGLLAGTTTVLNTFGSPVSYAGALSRIADGVSRVGLRAVLACELTGREGPAGSEAALEEVAGFAARAKGRLRAAAALGELDSVPDEALVALRAFHERRGLPLLVSLAEDRNEEARCTERFGKPPIDRLLDEGLVGERSVLAQGVHLSWPDLSRLLATGTWMVHTARSNMASQTGLATAAKFGVRACLGTDVLPLDMLAEAQAAALRANDSGQPIDPLRFLTNGHRLATHLFGAPFGALREGAVADLVVFDYAAPTPLTAQTLAGHLLQGLSARDVESVMIDGVWRLWKRRALDLPVAEVARASREAAQAVWARMAS